jgi:carboxypeptidase Q
LFLPILYTRRFSPQLRDQLQAVRDAALSSDYAWHQLAYLTENIGPRPAGSPQAQAAAEYVAAELRKLGLDVHLEPAQVSHWIRGEEQALLVDYPGRVPDTTQRIALTTISGSSATPPEGITADIVVVHSFGELTALGREKVAGKIRLCSTFLTTSAKPLLAWLSKPTAKPLPIARAEPKRPLNWAR